MNPKNKVGGPKLNPNARIRDSVKSAPKTSFGAALAKKSEELRTAEQEQEILEAVGAEVLRSATQNQPKPMPLSEEKSDDDGGEGW